MTGNENPDAAVAEMGDALRFLINQVYDRTRLAGHLAGTGPAGVDQAVAMLAELRQTAVNIAAVYCSDVTTYSSGGPVFTDQPNPTNGATVRVYHPWRQREGATR